MSPSEAQAKGSAATVERFEISENRPAFGGTSFEGVGSYQLIRAKAHVRVAPGHAANRGIVDLALAPRDPQGGVLYTADVVILRPRDASKARRVMIAEVPNRGMPVALHGLNGGNAMRDLMSMLQGSSIGAAYSTATAAGDGFLYRRGYTLVWVGWQASLPPVAALLGADFPVATGNGKPITGRVETTAVFDTNEPVSTIALPYPIATGSEGEAVLTVRARPGALPRVMPRNSWRFEGDRKVSVDRPHDMDAGALYQLVYTAKDPEIAGLGFAATRDIITFLRRGQADASGAANPLEDLRAAPCALSDHAACAATQGDAVDVVIGIGASQSGRYLRDMVWQGFNDDGAGQRVFDGVLVHAAGARRSFTNRRWAEPGRFSRQHEDPLVYGNQFPFAYGELKDPVTGRRDGLLATCARTGTCPRIFHIDGSSEFWNAGASLVFNDGAGHDMPIPGNVRAYMLAGAPHAPGLVNASSLLPPNPLEGSATMRALMVAMDEWVSAGIEPPASRWPTVSKGELAPPGDQAAIGFPTLAAIPFYGTANPVVVTDFGVVPPRPDQSRAWQVLVPITDADGNDRAGIRLPQVAFPEGTYLGWNPRKEGYAKGNLSFVFGGYVPFASTREERLANKDPRLSLAERYTSAAALQDQRMDAKRQLIADRLYLDADMQGLPRTLPDGSRH